jgi:recombinational DNA repair protein (RecF pathway)
MAVAWAGLEILERILPEGAPEEGLLDDAWGFFAALARCGDRAGAILLFYAFELRLLERLGHAPELTACRGCGTAAHGDGFVDAEEGAWVCQRCRPPGSRFLTLTADERQLLLALARAPWEVADLVSRHEIRRQVGRVLHHLLAGHIERYRYPRALGLLKKVDGGEDTTERDAEVD